MYFFSTILLRFVNLGFGLGFSWRLLSLSTVLLLSLIYFPKLSSSTTKNDIYEHNMNTVKDDQNVINGLGKAYQWYSLEEGLNLARKKEMPLMIIIHKTNCPACKAFKSKFSTAENVINYSKNFVMINISADNPNSEINTYSVDGKYVPRVFFLDWRGKLHPEIYNRKGNPDYKYFYFEMEDLIESMKKATSSLITANGQDEL